MKGLECYSPEELAILATVLGIGFTKTLDTDEQEVVGNFLETIGQVMSLVAAQIENIKNKLEVTEGDGEEPGKKDKNNEDYQEQIEELRRTIKNLENRINCM